MTIEIYHKSGERKPKLEVAPDLWLQLLTTIGDYGGMEGFDTDHGRMVVLAPRDYGEPKLSVQVMTPGQAEFETIELSKKAAHIIVSTVAEETLFGLAPVSMDHVALRRT